MNDAPAKSVLISLDSREYEVEAYRKSVLPPEAPRIVVVSSLQNRIAMKLLRICIRSVRRFTPEPHELWIVDNNSPAENISWLAEWPDINLVLNRTEPLPSEGREGPEKGLAPGRQTNWGSYANAVGLELAVRLIDADTQFLMSLHMDALPCRVGWLSYLQSKLDGRVAAAGVRIDRNPHSRGSVACARIYDGFPALPKAPPGFFP